MYFFTDLAKISSQTLEQGFGPVQGKENYQFSVTNRFSVSAGAPAYAIIAGTALVQSIGNDPASPLVNIAIKVGRVIETNYTSVAYIIYRGIKKSSLLKTDNSLADRGTNDFVTRIWDNWQAIKDKTAALPNPNDRITDTKPSSAALGWLLPSVIDETPLAHVFNRKDIAIQLTNIEEGSSIGVFDEAADVGIDVILEETLFEPTLATVRARYNILELTDKTQAAVYNPTYATKIESEKVFAYQDLCVLYAQAAKTGVKYYDSNNIVALNDTSQVYNTLLKKFVNCNVIYVDIRNETSNSLNYFNEYVSLHNYSGSPYPVVNTDPLFQIAANDDALVDFVATWPWPIFILRQLPRTTAAKIKFSFKLQNNRDPLVYLECATLPKKYRSAKKLASQSKFVSLFDPAQYDKNGNLTTIWSAALSIEVPVVQDNSSNQRLNLCWGVKFMVLRRSVNNTQPTAPQAPLRQNYADNIFGPIKPLPVISANDLCYQVFGKRWVCTGNIDNKVFFGAIVEPFRQYTEQEVFFGARVVEEYSSDMPKFAPGYLGKPDTVQSTASSNLTAYSSDALLQTWAKSTLGSSLRRFRISTARATDITVVAPEIPAGEPQTPGALTLYMSMVDYNDLLTIIQDGSFDLNINEIYIYFNKFEIDAAISQTPNIASKLLYSSSLTLGGITRGGFYSNITAENMPKHIPAYSLDGFRFNTKSIGQTSSLEVVKASESDYYYRNLIEDIKAVEAVYADSDQRIDQTVTRIRVHYYGFNYDDVENNTANYHGIPTFPFKDRSPEFGYRKDLLQVAAKGYIFNLDIPEADYWESDPSSLLPCLPNTATYALVPPSYKDFYEGCRVRQLYKSEVGAAYKGLVTGARRMIDPSAKIVDMAHTFFSLDGLFTGSAVHRGAKTDARTSNGFQNLDIDDPVELANFLGDLTGTLAVTYNRYYNEFSEEMRRTYSVEDLLALEYDITSPLPDLLSDTDGYGWYQTWINVFGAKPEVKLSAVVEHFYTATNSLYTYRNRWRIFCESQDFFQKGTDGKYYWRPDKDKIKERMDPAYTFGYFAEYSFGRLAHGAGIVLPNWYSDAILLLYNRKPKESDIDYVLNKFLGQAKSQLKLEQTGWDIVG